MRVIRTASLRLEPSDGVLHPADGEVAAHASLEPEAIDHITGLADGTGVVLCGIVAEPPPRRGTQTDVAETVGLAPSRRE